MKWEDFKKIREEKGDLTVSLKKIDVQCPVCGEDIYLIANMVITTSKPFKNAFLCKKCGWGESA